MNEIVSEWLAKADGDYRTATRELGVNDKPNFDAVCFHAHQCVEKTMKAVLIQHEKDAPRTHDLLHLADLLREACSGWDYGREELRFLTRSGIAFRYPGVYANSDQATEAMAICTRLREELLQLIAEK